MKRRAKILMIVLCITASFAVGILGGCGAAADGKNSLGDAETAIIIKAYFEQFYDGDDKKYDIDKIEIISYLGTYNGNIAVKLHDFADIETDVPEVEKEVAIDGVYIGRLNNAKYKFMVYMKNPNAEKVMLRLDEAYEKGYVTKTDLREIASREQINKSNRTSVRTSDFSNWFFIFSADRRGLLSRGSREGKGGPHKFFLSSD